MSTKVQDSIIRLLLKKVKTQKEIYTTMVRVQGKHNDFSEIADTIEPSCT